MQSSIRPASWCIEYREAAKATTTIEKGTSHLSTSFIICTIISTRGPVDGSNANGRIVRNHLHGQSTAAVVKGALVGRESGESEWDLDASPDDASMGAVSPGDGSMGSEWIVRSSSNLHTRSTFLPLGESNQVPRPSTIFS